MRGWHSPLRVCVCACVPAPCGGAHLRGFTVRTFPVPAPGRSVCWGHPGRPTPQPPPTHGTEITTDPNSQSAKQAVAVGGPQGAEEVGKCPEGCAALATCLTCASPLLPSLSASLRSWRQLLVCVVHGEASAPGCPPDSVQFAPEGPHARGKGKLPQTRQQE